MKKNSLPSCLVFLIALQVVLVSPIFGQSKISVVNQHNDLYRTGWNPKETQLNTSNVNAASFGLIGTLPVDDEIYAQPLVLNQVTIGGFNGSAVFVGTVNNTLYAFNADDLSAGAPIWQINLNPEGQRAPNIYDLKDGFYGTPCNGAYRDFSGRIGLVGTPVIDTLNMILYVATKTIDQAGNFYAYLNAIDIKTGKHLAGSPKKIEASVPGTGDGSVGGQVAYQAKYQNQRPALLLYNNTVYIASASHCDWGPYHGWILGYDAATLDLKYKYNATPNGWAGGIWMAGQGISVGEDGNLYVVTGNGTTGSNNSDLSGGRSESLIKLDPQLHMLDWFTPANFKYLDDLDLDYGCDGVLMIPKSTLTISGSKEGISYLVDYQNMGKLTPGNAQVPDTLEFNPNRQGYVHVHGSPVYAKIGGNENVYAWAESYKIRQFSLDRTTNTFPNTFRQGTRNLDNGMPGAMLSVSSNGNDPASAIVWASFPTSGNANNQVRPGTLVALPANDVSSAELWNSDLKKSDVVGNFSKFNSPTIANGRVFLSTFSKALKVYGQYCNGTNANLPLGDGNGVKGEYFNQSLPNAGFPATADLVQLDDGINFNWGPDAPGKGINLGPFKARWTGNLIIPASGNYTFYTIASNGVRLWIDDELIIDSWTAKPATQLSANKTLTQNATHTLRMEYFGNTGDAICILQWSAPGICKQAIPYYQFTAPPATCSGKGDGLTAEYFSNVDPASPFPAKATVTTTVQNVNFDWGNGSPNANISADHFKARFSGFVQTRDPGDYTFYVTGDDGVRLWVNDQLVIDGWKDQAATEYSGTISLQGCRKYSIRLEFYENGGAAVCQLAWQAPLTRKEAVPMEQLFTVSDQLSQRELIVYPNPARETLHLRFYSAFSPGDQIMLFDAVGQLVRKITLGTAIPSGDYSMETGNLAAGVYVLQFLHANRKWTEKLIISR